MAISAGQFPFISNGGMADDQSAPASAVGAGPQVGIYASSPHYLLPAMSNLRTKNDLLDIDRIMEQAQATIYDNAPQMAAAGLATDTQPGTYHISSAVDSRQSHSPPSIHVRSSHYGGVASASRVVTAPSPPRESPPALTPTGSVRSLPSNQSPTSLHSNGGTSPGTAGSMYPTLPVTSSAAMTNGYFPSSMAPASTLADQFNGDELRRFHGGNLGRSQLSRRIQKDEKHEDGMDLDDDSVLAAEDGSSTISSDADDVSRTRDHQRKAEVSASVIDPALSGVASPSTGEMDEGEIMVNNNWVVMARTIESLRSWIQQRVENGEFEPDEEQAGKADLEETPGLYPVLPELSAAV